MTTVAVTGVSGNVGAALLGHLSADPAVERIVGVDVIDPPWHAPKMTFHRLDIRDPNLAAVLRGVDVLVHLAFLFSGREELLRNVNLGGLRNALEAAGGAGVGHVVFPSSVLAYGAHPDNRLPLTEESPLRPNAGSLLAEQKAASEEEIRAWQADHPGVAVSILRLAPVFGPNADNFYSRLLESPVILGVRGHEPALCVVHEEDAASAVHFVISHQLAGVYNVCADRALPRAEVLSRSGRPQVIVSETTLVALVRMLHGLGVVALPPGEVSYHVHPWEVSNEKLRAAGWSPAHSVEEAFEQAVEAHSPYVSVGVLRATRVQWARALLLTGAVAGAAGAAAAWGVRRRAG